MAQVQNSSLPFNDSAVNGNVVTQTEWNQVVQVLQAAINDNFYRIVEKFNLLNADGTTNTSMNVSATSGVSNVLQFEMGAGITISAIQSGGDITFTFSIANGAITEGMLASGILEDVFYTQTQLDNGQLDNRYYTQSQLTGGELDLRYYTQTQLDNGQLNTLYYTKAQVDAEINNASYTKTVQTGTAFPSSPTSGQEFYRTDQHLLYVYDSSQAQWNLPGAQINAANNWQAKQTFGAGMDLPSGQTGTVEGTLTPSGTGSISATDLSGLQASSVLQNRKSPNLVSNSGFEQVTSTATVFSDALTSYIGSTVPAPWTLQAGSFTFGASGATTGANGSLMTAGNAVWKPVVGSDGKTKLAITVQATFTSPSSGAANGYVDLHADATNGYRAVWQGDSNFVLYKWNSFTSLASDNSNTQTSSETYSLSLSLDNTGLLTATLRNNSGTVLKTLTATDTSLTGGFLVGVGGDTGVVISNVSVTAPWANGWTIGGDSRVAWGLTSSAIGGKYSASAVGMNGINAYATQSVSNIPASSNYTISGYMETSNVSSSGGAGAMIEASGVGSTFYFDTQVVSGTTSTTRYSASGTTPTGTTGANVNLIIRNSGTATFDNIQLETGSSATPYLGDTQYAQTSISAPSFIGSGTSLTGVALTGSANTFTANQTAPALISSGLTGATASSRYAGATTSGAPTSGTFAIGDFVIDQSGSMWVCTVAGTPGTWVRQNIGEFEVALLFRGSGMPGSGADYYIYSSASQATASANINVLLGSTSLSNIADTKPFQAKISNVSSSVSYYYDATFDVGSSGHTAYTGLWDATAGVLVSGSTLSTTSTTSVNLRTPVLTLIAGHAYQPAMWSDGSTPCNLFVSRIVGKS